MRKNKNRWIVTMLMSCLLIPIFTLMNPLIVSADGNEDGRDAWPIIEIEEEDWTTAFPETDPWEILAGEDKVEYLGGNRFSASLFSMLKQTVILFCMVIAFCCIIAIPWVNSSEGVKQNKEKLTHTLLIMAIAFLVIPGFNFVKFVLDSMFGL